MASKNLNEKQMKALQDAHLEFREAAGSRIVTASKIQEYCKALGHRCEGGLETEVAELVYKALWKAVLRCDGNNRSTVKDVDL